jgi:alkylation response protein AidB-like acyl-CoA dehydrogenase
VIVPADREGVETGPAEALLGLHGAQTAPLYLEDVEVGADEILGDAGRGLEQLSEPLRVSRLAIAACATGLIEASLAASQDFADQREQFDEPIRNFQAIQNRLAGMKAAASTARSLTLRAADRRDNGQGFSSQASEAKWRATEEASEHTRSAIRLHGGTGYMREAHVERYYRDARTLKIMGGPNQLHRQRVVDQM